MEYIYKLIQEIKRFRFHLIVLLSYALAFTVNGAELTPSAQIVSADTAYCESGMASIKVKFSGKPRFGVILNIRYLDGSGSGTIDINTDAGAIELSEMSADTVWTYIITRDKSYEVTIEKVFDGTMTMSEISPGVIGWKYSQGTNYGTGKMTVIVDQMPVPNAGADAIVCNYQDTLAADLPDLPINTFSWKSVASVLFNDATSRTPIVKVPTEGDYMFWVKETSGTCNATDSVIYRFRGHAKAELLGADKEICVKDSLPFTVTSVGNHPLIMQLTNGVEDPSQEYLVNSSNFNDSIDVLSSRTFVIYKLTDKNGCITPAEDLKGEVSTIDLFPKPTIGEDQTICGNSIDVTASTNVGVGHWEGDGTFENPNASSTKFTTNNGYGIYPITWVVDNKGCKNDTVMYGEFFKSPSAYAGDNQRLFLQTETELNAKVPEFGKGTWFTSQAGVTILDLNDPKSKISGLGIGTTTLRWIEENGVCLADTSFTSVEVKEFTYSTAFTPNGDGINDKFEIFGLIQQPISNNELKIFDANGRLLYSQKDYDNSWDGRDNAGNDLPSGAYYYLFSGDGIEPVKNFLIIKRK